MSGTNQSIQQYQRCRRCGCETPPKDLDLWGVVVKFIREQEQDLKVRCEDNIISPLREISLTAKEEPDRHHHGPPHLPSFCRL